MGVIQMGYKCPGEGLIGGYDLSSPWLLAVLDHAGLMADQYRGQPFTFRGKTISGSVSIASFSPADPRRVLTVAGDGRSLYTPQGSQYAYIWDVPTNTPLLMFAGATRMTRARYSPDATLVYTTESSPSTGSIYGSRPGIWISDAYTGAPLAVLPEDEARLATIEFSPDSRRLLLSGTARTPFARVYDLASALPILDLPGSFGAVYSPWGNQIAAVGGGGVRVYDAFSGRELFLLPSSMFTQVAEHVSQAPLIVYSHAGGLIFTSLGPEPTRGAVWSALTGSKLLELATQIVYDKREGIRRVPSRYAFFTFDDRYLVTIDDPDQGGGLEPAALHVWDMVTGAEIRTWSMDVNYAALSPVSYLVATVSQHDPRVVHVLDILSGAELQTLYGHGARIYGLEFSPDGTLIVTASGDATARVWRAATAIAPGPGSPKPVGKGWLPCIGEGWQGISGNWPGANWSMGLLPQAGLPVAQMAVPALPPTLPPQIVSGSITSAAELVQALELNGISLSQILALASSIEGADAGEVLEYLRVAAFDGTFDAQRLQAHLQMLPGIPGSHFGLARRFLQQVRHLMQLSPDIDEWVKDHGLAEALHAALLAHCGLEKVRDPVPRTHQVAYLRSLLRMVEEFKKLTTDDPNVTLLLRIVNQYGSVLRYYADHYIPQACVRRLAELGFDIDYMIFGTGEVLSLGPAPLTDAEKWPENFVAILKRLIGGRDAEPELDLGIDRRQLFHQIRTDFDVVKKDADKDAAVRIINRLLPEMERAQERYLRTGDIGNETDMKQCGLELLAIRRLLTSDDGSTSAARLIALRSPKLIPEIFFDNTRLSCCLFKPNGLFHGEICRLVLDPATPILEFWLEPQPEFLGLATMYAGLNAQGERVILMDTIDYNDHLLDLRGYNGTMRFMLDAIVLDAFHSGAQKLLVFSAPWGKPLGFANFVKQIERRAESVQYAESYYWEKADPDDVALVHSLAGTHHYTEAFGYNRPMAGVIDYGYNLVTLASVDKLLTGGRGVFEIDVALFVAEFGLNTSRPTQQDVPGAEQETQARDSGAVLFQKPPEHDEEIRYREAEALAAANEALQVRAGADLALELLRSPGNEVISECMQVENTSFSPELRYSEAEVRERLHFKDAELILVRERSSLVGFALSYVLPAISRTALFLDDLAVRGELQSRGIGSVMLNFLTSLASIRGYSGLYAAAEWTCQLSRFYERANFTIIGGYPELGQVFYRPLSLVGPENASKLSLITSHFERKLRQYLSSPRVTIHTALDHDLLATLSSLEAVFPQDMRYSQAMFRTRINLPDAYIVVFREQHEPIAYCLSFRDPSLPSHAISLDSLSVKPEYQMRGIGRLMIELVFAIPTLTRYTIGLFECRQRNHDGVDLVEYYTRFGARVVDRRKDRVRMTILLDHHWREFDDQSTYRPASGTRASRGPLTAPVPVRRILSVNAPSVPIVTRTNGAAAPEPVYLDGGNGTHQACVNRNMTLELARLPFLGKAEARTLADCGVHTTQQFLQQAGSRDARARLAAESGVSGDVLAMAAHFADIARTGVVLNHLARLNRYHIRTLDAFRNCDVTRLRRVMPAQVTDEELTLWRECAYKLESLVED
jgi:WD40 repeat protein/ribosomal protein S18 acetylase RimI-like enzyme